MMNFEQLLSGGGMGAMGPTPGQDIPTMDTAETVQISSLALLKVQKNVIIICPFQRRCYVMGVQEFPWK